MHGYEARAATRLIDLLLDTHEALLDERLRCHSLCFHDRSEILQPYLTARDHELRAVTQAAWAREQRAGYKADMQTRLNAVGRRVKGEERAPAPSLSIASAIAVYWRSLADSVDWPDSVSKLKTVPPFPDKWKAQLGRATPGQPTAKKRKLETKTAEPLTFAEAYIHTPLLNAATPRLNEVGLRRKLIVRSLRWLCGPGIAPHPPVPYAESAYSKSRLFFRGPRTCQPAYSVKLGATWPGAVLEDLTIAQEGARAPAAAGGNDGPASAQVRTTYEMSAEAPVLAAVVAPSASGSYKPVAVTEQFEVSPGEDGCVVVRAVTRRTEVWYRSPTYLLCPVPRENVLLAAAVLPLVALPQPQLLSAVIALMRLSEVHKLPTFAPPASTQSHLKAALQSMYQTVSGGPAALCPVVGEVSSVTLTVSAIQDYCATLVTKVADSSEWLKRAGFGVYAASPGAAPDFLIRRARDGWECLEVSKAARGSARQRGGGFTATVELLAFCLRRYERERKKGAKSDISSFLSQQPSGESLGPSLTPKAVPPPPVAVAVSTTIACLPEDLSLYGFLGQKFLGPEKCSAGHLFPDYKDLNVAAPNLPPDFLGLTSFEGMCKTLDRRNAGGSHAPWSAATGLYTVPTVLNLFCNKKLMRRSLISWHPLEEVALWQEVARQKPRLQTLQFAEQMSTLLQLFPYAEAGPAPEGVVGAVDEELLADLCAVNWTLVCHAVSLATGVFDQSKSRNACIAKFVSLVAEKTYCVPLPPAAVAAVPAGVGGAREGKRSRFLVFENNEPKLTELTELTPRGQASLDNVPRLDNERACSLELTLFSAREAPSAAFVKLRDWYLGGCGSVNLLGYLQLSGSGERFPLQFADAHVAEKLAAATGSGLPAPEAAERALLAEQIETVALHRLAVLINAAEEQCLKNKFRSFEALASDKQLTSHLQLSLAQSHLGRAFLSAFKYFVSNHPRVFQASHKNLPYEGQLINAIATNFARIVIPHKAAFAVAPSPAGAPAFSLPPSMRLDLVGAAMADPTLARPEALLWRRAAALGNWCPEALRLVLWRLLAASRQFERPEELPLLKTAVQEFLTARLVLAALLAAPGRALGLRFAPLVVPAVSGLQFPSARQKKAPAPPPPPPGALWRGAPLGWQYGAPRAAYAPAWGAAPPSAYFPVGGAPPPGVYYFPPPPPSGAWGGGFARKC